MTVGNRVRKGQIQFKHGNSKDIPKRMSVAEPGFAVDTQDLYIGQGSTKAPVNITGNLRKQIEGVQNQLEEFGTRKFRADLIDTTTMEKSGTIFIDSEGIKFVDLNGNVILRLGSDFDVHFKSATIDNLLNWRSLGFIRATTGVPSNYYVSPKPTGDGTGRDKSNYADNIQDVIKHISSFGRYLNKNITIHILGGTYYNVDVSYFEAFLGNGTITLNFAKDVVGQYKITVRNTNVLVKVQGNRVSHLGDTGAVLDSPNEMESLFRVENAVLQVEGIRSKKVADTFKDSFAHIGNNGVIYVKNVDVAQYENMYKGYNGFIIHDQNNIGNCTRRLDGTDGVMYYGGYRINPKNDNALDAISYTKLFAYTSPSTSTGKDSLYVPSASTEGDKETDTGGGESPNPNPPVVTPPEEVRKTVEKSFSLTNLHTTVSGSGLFTSTKTAQMGQGHWVNSNGSPYQNHTGHGTIPADVKTFVADAVSGTVEIQLTLHRMNSGHGYAGAVPVPRVKRPNGTYYNEGKGVARNSSITLTLPSDLVTAICNGTVTEINTYSSSQNDYAFFDTASLKVICTKILKV